MLPLLLERTRTEFFLWLRSDSRLAERWEDEVVSFITQNKPFDAAGLPSEFERSPEYRAFLRARRWFVSEDKFISTHLLHSQSKDDARKRVVFPDGPLFLGRTGYFKQHNYPDREEARNETYCAPLLGDLLLQQNGRFVSFDGKLLEVLNIKTEPQIGSMTLFTGPSNLPAPVLGVDELVEDVFCSAFPSVGTKPCPEEKRKDSKIDFIYYNDQGNQLSSQRRHLEAAIAYRQALILAPDRPEIHYNLANCLRNAGHNEEAIASFERALELKPDYGDALNNMGIVYAGMGRNEKAVEVYHAAIKSNPRNAGAYNNLGNSLEKLGRWEEAVSAFIKAVEIAPEHPVIHHSLGKLLFLIGDYNRALLHFRIALHQRLDFPEARVSRARFWLSRGEYEAGFREYQHRTKLQGYIPRDFKQPAWDGRSLADKTILLYQEQDCAETLHLVRYVKALQDLGAEVLIECRQSLVKLFSRIHDVEVFPQGDPLPAFDMHASFQDLPRILRTTRENLPSQVPYLRVPRHSTIKLGAVPPHAIRVGVVWREDMEPRGGTKKDCSLADFQRLYEVPGTVLVSLQTVKDAADVKAFEQMPMVQQLGFDAKDYRDMASLISQMDLVICVESSIAHLAGALGKPVWALLSRRASWPWQRDQAATPWYPSAKLYWQTGDGKWDAVISQVVVDLERLVEDRFSQVELPVEFKLEGAR